MPRLLAPDDLLDHFEQSTGPVVLPRALAATRLKQAFARRQQRRGLAVWTPPNVFAWTQWTGSLWTQIVLSGADDRLLLNAAQEEVLWRDVIAASGNSTLIPAASLASLAQSGWALAAGHRATSLLKQRASTIDTQTFATWAESFRTHCHRERLLPAAELDFALEQHLREGHFTAPPSLTLCAATELTPSQQSLLHALEEAGTRLDHVQVVTIPSADALRATTLLPDERDELRFALRFLRSFLDRDPDTRAALILPDAEAERATLEPLLLETLAPELTTVDTDLSSLPWAFTSGAPLSTTPVTRSILDLARWLRGPLPLERLSALLTSPFLCPPAERDARARFAAGTLGRQLLLRPELDLRHTLRLARSDAPTLAGWLEPLADLAAKTHPGVPRRSFADWTETLRALARSAHWPGERTLTAQEASLTEAFDAVLDLVATLDFSGKRVTFAEACDAVETEAARTPAPSAASDAPLTILSAAQATDLTFDLVLLARATDAHLPAAQHPHALLDRGLQRDLRMPGALPAADADRARSSLAAILQAAQHVLITSAAHNADGALRPSALPATFGLISMDPADLVAAETPRDPIPLQITEDLAPLPPLPSHEVAGGARLLKLQAACGFLAFAELRLGSKQPDALEPGFDAIESGNVLHRALESFWNTVKTQQNLRNLPELARENALREAIDKAVSHRLRVDGPWDLAYLDVQKERMLRLLKRWLDFELDRSPFTVLESEHDESIAVGPLQLKVRMDRIDQLPQGGHVLVDYKTGLSARTAAWQGDRPDEPQLPLYALLGEPDELRGLAFARIRAGEDMSWQGFFADADILPRKKQVDLITWREEWRSVLDRLAQDFHDGHTEVHPKSYAVNCKRCAQRLLCRLDVAQLLGHSNADEEEEDIHE